VSQKMTDDDIAPLAGAAFASAFQASIAFAKGNAMSNDSKAMPTYELVQLMTDYASKYGFLLGGLEMVAARHATAEAVLESYRKKYEQPEPDAVTKHRTLEKTT
jgi:hypothetical protein